MFFFSVVGAIQIRDDNDSGDDDDASLLYLAIRCICTLVFSLYYIRSFSCNCCSLLYICLYFTINMAVLKIVFSQYVQHSSETGWKPSRRFLFASLTGQHDNKE